MLKVRLFSHFLSLTDKTVFVLSPKWRFEHCPGELTLSLLFLLSRSTATRVINLQRVLGPNQGRVKFCHLSLAGGGTAGTRVSTTCANNDKNFRTLIRPHCRIATYFRVAFSTIFSKLQIVNVECENKFDDPPGSFYSHLFFLTDLSSLDLIKVRGHFIGL